MLFCNEVSATSLSNVSSSDSSDSVDAPLFKNSSTSTSKFSNDSLALKAKHCISDAGADALLRLFANTLPVPNVCPSLRKLVFV